jgi:hypothetical protein
MSTQFTTIARTEIFDALCDAVDYARGAASDNPAWLNAINKAWDYLLSVETIAYDRMNRAIRVESATRPGRAYVSNGECQCEAFTKGNGVCWHRAAARLVARALEIHDLAAELLADALADGDDWYTPAIALAGARSRLVGLECYAREWDRDAFGMRNGYRPLTMAA